MKKIVFALILSSLLISGCSSVPVNMGTSSSQIEGVDYKVLGEGEGTSTGIMLFNIIPIGQNDRFKSAYEEAILSKGGDRLINPVIEERWFWGYILNGYSFTVKGTVIKNIVKDPKPVAELIK